MRDKARAKKRISGQSRRRRNPILHVVSVYTFASWISGLTLLIAFSFVIPFCLQIGPEDREGYELLKKENSEMHAKSAINELPVVQLRQGTRKDLWKMQEGSMRHYQLFSENSRLTLTQKRKRFESVETFDEAYGSKGSEFAFSAASGYVDKETFFLEGDLELTLEIDGKLSTACADSASFNKEESKLILESLPSKHVILQQEGLTISAPRIEIGDKIEAKGNVQILREESPK